MGHPPAPQLPNVVALERVQPHIEAKDIFKCLRKYGWILNIQFWISSTGKKHGFVTLRDADSVPTCLGLGDSFAPSFFLRPVNPTSAHRYRDPHGNSKDGLDERHNRLSNEPSPSLTSRLPLPSDEAIPSLQFSLANKSHPMDTAEGGKPSVTFAPEIQEPSTSQAANSSTKNGTPAIQQSLPTSLSAPLASLPSEPMLIDQSNRDMNGFNQRRATEIIINLTQEIQRLQISLRDVKDSCDRDLKTATDDANHYRTERNRLKTDLEKAIKDVDYFQNLSEVYKKERQELKTQLTLQDEAHRKREEGLRRDAKNATSELLGWKKTSENQSRLLSDRQLELDDARKRLREMQDQLHAGHNQKDREMLHAQSKENAPGIEEGQWESQNIVPAGDSTKLSKFPSPMPSRKELVISALEKAFIQLDEIIGPALQEAVAPEPYNPHKRRRRDDPS